MEHSSHYQSPLGELLLTARDGALTGLWFAGQKGMPSARGYREKEVPVIAQAKKWLDIYFSVGAPDFVPPLCLKGTHFQKKVWENLLAIPYGETVTYGAIAKRIGVPSAQAVGGAVGRNPIAIIVPCHRVVGAKGQLVGFAGGLDKKEALLKMEHSRGHKEEYL